LRNAAEKDSVENFLNALRSALYAQYEGDMKITKDVVEYVAHLARLELEPSEIELYTVQLDRILQYMDALNSLDTENVKPTSHAVPLDCVLRGDEVRPSFERSASVQNAPEKKGTFFKVPPVIEVE
jgi:aspartyl-tRNA(Asn)/glutamyl-tRNA(Gln) amidotransferase subunit C